MANPGERLLTPIEFIREFFSVSHNSEDVRNTFMRGYCYYFAYILKEAMGRGKVCWAAPFSHVVWVDDNGIAYDADREYKSDAVLIPITNRNKNLLRGLLHNTKPEYAITKDDIIKIFTEDDPEYKVSKEDLDWVIDNYYKE